MCVVCVNCVWCVRVYHVYVLFVRVCTDICCVCVCLHVKHMYVVVCACILCVCICADICVAIHMKTKLLHSPQRRSPPSDHNPGPVWGLLQKVTPGARPGQTGNAALWCGRGWDVGKARVRVTVGAPVGVTGTGWKDLHGLEAQTQQHLLPGGRAPGALLIHSHPSSLLRLWGQSQIRLKTQDPGQTKCRARPAALLAPGTPVSHFGAVSPRAGGRAGQGCPLLPRSLALRSQPGHLTLQLL